VLDKMAPIQLSLCLY